MRYIKDLLKAVSDAFVWLICIAFAVQIAQVQGLSGIDIKDDVVELRSDEPAVVGAPIGFSARLVDSKDNSSVFTYRFVIRNKFEKSFINQTNECNITLTMNEEGSFEMKVWIERDGIKLGKASTIFKITTFLNGVIQVDQKDTRAKMPGIISTNTSANVSFAIHDPHNYFQNASFFHGWAIDAASLSTTESNFTYNFTTASTYHLMLMVTVFINDLKPKIFVGTFSKQLIAKNPIKMSNVSGQTDIQHGDLLDIEISCEGSTPISYCWYFTQGSVNMSSASCEETTETSICEFVVVRYFKKSGNYKLVLIVDNEIDHRVNLYNINVFQRGAEPQLSPIIVPLACSCVALVIVVVGIMYYIQTRRNYMVEVADFDFQHSDNYEFHSFVQRMLEAFKTLCGNANLRQRKSSVYKRIPAQIT